MSRSRSTRSIPRSEQKSTPGCGMAARFIAARPAASHLLERQRSAIAALKAAGITVKINTIVVPGINENHVDEVAAEMRELGADIMNCIPLYPVEDTPFADRRSCKVAKSNSSGNRWRNTCRRWSTARAAAPMPLACWESRRAATDRHDAGVCQRIARTRSGAALRRRCQHGRNSGQSASGRSHAPVDL